VGEGLRELAHGLDAPRLAEAGEDDVGGGGGGRLVGVTSGQNLWDRAAKLGAAGEDDLLLERGSWSSSMASQGAAFSAVKALTEAEDWRAGRLGKYLRG
jgi:hypothetical protein